MLGLRKIIFREIEILFYIVFHELVLIMHKLTSLTIRLLNLKKSLLENCLA